MNILENTFIKLFTIILLTSKESIDGGFSDWSVWTECSVTCGGGEQTRTRTCSNPEPQNGGNDCVGDLEESQTCSTDACPGYTKLLYM